MLEVLFMKSGVMNKNGYAYCDDALSKVLDKKYNIYYTISDDTKPGMPEGVPIGMVKNIRLEEDGNMLGEFVFFKKEYEEEVANKTKYAVISGYGYVGDDLFIHDYDPSFFYLSDGSSYLDWYEVKPAKEVQLEFEF